jgi:TnpA family transposase
MTIRPNSLHRVVPRFARRLYGDVGNQTPGTVDVYTRILRQFTTWLAERPGISGAFQPDQLTVTALDTYLKEREARGVSYKDLVYMRCRFITRDYLRAAIQTVANGIFQARLASIWGEATTSCASDSKKFGAWEQNLITEWHNRYGGRGVVIYWHVEKKATCIYSQLKHCSSSEVAAAITGVIRHCTEMQIKQHYVDSHGQSEVAFGMCHLLGYELCPRLKPIHSQKLYLVDSADASRYPRLKPVLTRSIDWALIRQEYDELVKYATAIGSGLPRQN